MSLTMMHYLLLILGFLGSMATYTLVHRAFSPAVQDETDVAKIAKSEKSLETAFSALNPKGSFVERLDLWLLNTLKIGKAIENLHMMMGRPEKPTPLDILHQKELLASAFGALFGLLTGNILFGIFGLVVGFILPDSLFKKQVEVRQAAILRNFPTFVDLAALTIESGLDYLSAFERIVKNAKTKTELEVEIDKTLTEVRLGYSRRDALERMALRTGLQEIRSFVGLIIQSDELGTSLVELLRNYAADMRFRRLNKAEKLAAQASTKMLIPLFIFIFPTVFIMMLSPMIKSLLKGGLGF